MNKRLQDFSFRVSRYFRPLQAWHCGGMDDANQCAMGPDSEGRCPLAAKCQPALDGHAYQCSRSDLLGGACQSGPTPSGECGQRRLPCTPTKNVASRRFRIALLALLVVTGLAVSGLVFDVWRTSVSAGALSVHHASFGEQNCDACHTSSAEGKSQWVSGMFREHAISDAEKCIDCHQIGEQPSATHSLDSGMLASLSDASAADVEGVQKKSLLLKAATLLRGHDAPNLVCADCHQEHRGRSADITTASASVLNQQCAVCHSKAFDDFAGHAAFVDYPAERRTRIIFNHNSHIFKHFKQQDARTLAPESCTSCHAPDTLGQTMELTGFETSCSSCHFDETNAESSAGDKGVALLSVPALDLDTLQERGVNIGDWPQQSNAELTPFMVWLLTLLDDKNEQLDVDRLMALELYDLRNVSEEDLELVYNAAWRIKRLFFELQRGGGNGLDQWLSQGDDEARSARQMWGLMSPNLIDSAVASAFPNLQEEVSRWLQKGMPVFYVRHIGNHVPGNSPTLSEGSSATKGDILSEQSNQGVNDDVLFDEDGDSSGSQDDLFAEDGDESEDILSDEDALFDEDSDQAFALDDVDGSEADLLDDDAWMDGADTSVSDSLSTISVERMQDVELSPLRSIEDRTRAGGWYWENYYLRYRPGGHADPFMAAWIDYFLRRSVQKVPALDTVRREFLSADKPGSCVKCHSVEKIEGPNQEALRINWFGARSVPDLHGFDRFAHRSHLEVAGRQSAPDKQGGCVSCHELNPESDSSANYSHWQMTDFSTDFFNLDKEACLDCHTDNAELQSCTLCHNYHVGPRGSRQLEANKLQNAVKQSAANDARRE